MRMLSVFWGDHHTDLFIKGLCQSLLFKDNREIVNNSIWTIYTDEDRCSKILSLTKSLFPGSTINVLPTKRLRRYTDPIQCALVYEIEECLKSNQKLLLAPPDTIFGNNSIRNLQLLAYKPKTVVCSPHPRVLPSIIEEIGKYSPDHPPRNERLCTLAWNHLHKSWTNAELNSEFQSSFIGGVVWQAIDPNIISVQHLLPTVYLADFTVQDLDYFKTTTSFGDWDHTWAIRTLKENRQRYAASSDLCFILEVTEEHKNIPPYYHTHPKDDSFWKNNDHNIINRGIIATFRKDNIHYVDC